MSKPNQTASKNIRKVKNKMYKKHQLRWEMNSGLLDDRSNSTTKTYKLMELVAI